MDIVIKKRRFSPLPLRALDKVYDKYSRNGLTLTQEEANKYILETNGEIGRGEDLPTTHIFYPYEEGRVPRSDIIYPQS